jgi:hypothetical protein
MLWMPGFLVALIVSGFKVHDYSLGVSGASNVAFYSAMTYLCIGKTIESVSFKLTHYPISKFSLMETKHRSKRRTLRQRMVRKW